MKILDRNFHAPEQDLACDEALLDRADSEDSGEVIRFWESPFPFIVLGFSNAWQEEVEVRAGRPALPVLRRVSGGGTVIQGPGCLNYALVLKVSPGGPLDEFLSANRHIMERHRLCLERLLKKPVRVQGSTDLTLGDLKFSGNAQRRKRSYLLFHGTFLLDFDLSLLENLKMPPKQPAYRLDRPHGTFVTNLEIGAARVKEALAEEWGASGVAKSPDAELEELAHGKYSDPAWNLLR